jgi:MFS family permease
VTAPFDGWRAVWAGFLTAFCAWGLGFYGPGVYLAALHEARGWPVSLISAAITLHFLCGAMLVARFPALEARFGLARVILAGAVLSAIGVTLWAWVPAAWMLFGAALLTGAGWALTSGAAVNAIVAPWFERRRPAALSMAYNGASVGGVVFTPLWALLVASLGFALAAPLVGVVTLLAMGVLAWTILGATPESRGQRVDGATAEQAAATPPPPARAPLPPPPRRVAGAALRHPLARLQRGHLRAGGAHRASVLADAAGAGRARRGAGDEPCDGVCRAGPHAARRCHACGL